MYANVTMSQNTAPRTTRTPRCK